MPRGGIPTHGLSMLNGKARPEHSVWLRMRGRCYRKTDKEYPYYGARGIQVCERWRKSFADFFSDMGARPSDLHSIERKNNNGNYEPENCIWATKKVQARNRRTNKIIEYLGRNMSLAEACELADINYSTAYARIVRGTPFNYARKYTKRSFSEK